MFDLNRLKEIIFQNDSGKEFQIFADSDKRDFSPRFWSYCGETVVFVYIKTYGISLTWIKFCW